MIRHAQTPAGVDPGERTCTSPILPGWRSCLPGFGRCSLSRAGSADADGPSHRGRIQRRAGWPRGQAAALASPHGDLRAAIERRKAAGTWAGPRQGHKTKRHTRGYSAAARERGSQAQGRLTALSQAGRWPTASGLPPFVHRVSATTAPRAQGSLNFCRTDRSSRVRPQQGPPRIRSRQVRRNSVRTGQAALGDRNRAALCLAVARLVRRILGSNGAGKTTTVECIEGLRAPRRGCRAAPGRPRSAVLGRRPAGWSAPATEALPRSLPPGRN
jgi:hypothetical protein